MSASILTDLAQDDCYGLPQHVSYEDRVEA